MTTKYLDTNLLLRLVIKDDPQQVEYVKNLLHEASQKKYKLFVSIVVMFECEWVLRSFYKFSKNDLALILQKILLIGEIDFENLKTLYQALEKMQQNNLGLEDNYHLAFCQTQSMKLETFDKKLKNQLK